MARYGVGRVADIFFGHGFPAGTLIVNVVGSFFMGLLVQWLSQRQGAELFRLFLGVGVLGAFTTFSTFSLDIVNLVRERIEISSVIYLLASVIGAIGALLLGIVVGRSLS
ncbi:MAG: fluoride efflux transporter CrcB [Parvularculaceae bacterium]|nr:MAG: fluoride efflux transporter CrcB [Parvularculaceae bacterium]